MRFLDSNVLAYAFYENDKRELCQRIIAQGGIVNTLNIAEAFNVLAKELSRDEAQQCVKGLFRSKHQYCGRGYQGLIRSD